MNRGEAARPQPTAPPHISRLRGNGEKWMDSKSSGRRMGFALCGSFCTFARVLDTLAALVADGWEVTPIMSTQSATTDTRFGTSQSFRTRLSELCGRPVIDTIAAAEPIGPKKCLDVLVVAPATGNTLAKIAAGIADTPPTLAVKSHLRNERPVVLAVSTNDGLGGNGANIGALMARKHIYLVPFGQDDPKEKPNSLVADFSLIGATAEAALRRTQLQPLLLRGTGQ